MGNSAKRDVKAVEAAQRRAKAWSLRARYLTMREIAAELGVSVSCIHKDLKTESEELQGEAAAEVQVARETICEALGTIVKAHLPDATAAVDPSNESANTCIKALTAIAKIKGAEAPARSELTGKDGGPIETANTSDEILRRLARIAEARPEGEGDPKPESGGR